MTPPTTPPTDIPASTYSRAQIEQLQSIFDTLEDAVRACDALGDQAGSSDEKFTWGYDALMVCSAADALRFALNLHLSYSTAPVPAPDRDADPVTLLGQAWSQLEDMPDELDNLPLLLARLDVADVLAAARARDE